MGAEIEAIAGEDVTLFADHYDTRARGLPTDFWSCDGESSYQFTTEPIKGRRLACLKAEYAGKKIISHPNASTVITFKVRPGTHVPSLLFDVGSSPYDLGRLMQRCADGTEREVCAMSAEYPVAEVTVEGKPRERRPATTG